MCFRMIPVLLKILDKKYSKNTAESSGAIGCNTMLAV